MSRSRRYTPIISNTLSGLRNGEGDDKSIANREFRRTNKMLINDALATDNLEEMILHDRLQEVSNRWDFIKDGKHYLDKNSKYFDEKYMRK
jgi:hypothetical protein